MLEQSAIAHYLLSLGLVKPQAVIEEELTIVDASRRNCVFLAATPGGPTYVVKQADARHASTLAHEAAVLRVLAEARELAGQVPRVVCHEPDEARLVLCTPAGALDWSDHHGAGRFPRLPPRILGRTLAAVHRFRGDAVEKPPRGLDAMWGLSLPEPRHELLIGLSAGAQDLVARLQASQGLCDRLHELCDSPAEDVLVHGDLRWENCLAVAAPGAQRRTRVLLVDWELAGPGPAAYDVGAVLAEYLASWVGSIPIVEPGDPGRLAARARHPLRRLQPAMQSLWSAYRTAGARREPLRRVVELAAVWLLQTAVERAQGLVRPTAHVVTLVQLADNMLRSPDDAAVNLMGLRD
jgi:aminoglycoside phosphotransferase (APT) family kinase protein